ncbi:Clan CA, family C54, ATG4-like cysteine peptidase [Tritrichomonas foetus]|uniref:Cysteine protease n=1 Tax=Tritrichomonas foetus TaxID=1144522 RepID=A0A1J4JQK0_9EUKA|nr:Clan CA, family C54, ATG4-like cysteine peptidase [Tritrichomonas foetus]|eukprot:OHT01447.1 Clan CA, family C54, ATG4-like cysteine peptidase [Tritrichomonas foetus]
MISYLKSFWGTSKEDHTDEYKERPRFTYRSDFAAIPNTNIISDIGWGCCYRCTQGIIAQYLKIIDEINHSLILTRFSNIKNDDIISLFEDTLEAPFSIQNLVSETSKLGVAPGEWAKPSQIAIAFSNILDNFNLHNYTTLNCLIEPSKIQDDSKYPMILMVSLMCGLQQLDELHFPFLKYVFSLPETIGIVSGYSGSAYYVVKIDDSENVFYFDPHVVQPAVATPDLYETFYNQKIMMMSLSQMNPSILLCFVCRDRESTEKLVTNLSEFPGSPVSLSECVSDEILEKVLDIDDLDLS